AGDQSPRRLRQRSIADPYEGDVPATKRFEGRNHVGGRLLRREPAHGSDDQRVIRQSEAAASQRAAALRRLWNVEIDRAGDGANPFRRRDLEANGFGRYGAADREESIGDAAKSSLDLDVGRAKRPRLTVVKGEAVKGVDDRRHAGAARRDSSQSAGLAAVCVHDVEISRPQLSRQLCKRPVVLERIDLMAHVGEPDDLDAGPFRLGKKRTAGRGQNRDRIPVGVERYGASQGHPASARDESGNHLCDAEHQNPSGYGAARAGAAAVGVRLNAGRSSARCWRTTALRLKDAASM